MQKHPDLAAKQIRIARPALVRHWRKLLRNPHLTVGLVVLKAVEYLGLMTGIRKAARGRQVLQAGS